jgi:hypothetical protein
MESKAQILSKLTEIFTHWQVLLPTLSDGQIHAPLIPSTWTVKDVVAHMWAWQQGSVARAEAALLQQDPHSPGWWEANSPDPEEDVDRTNAWIYQANRDKPWSNVYSDWQGQFARYIELLKKIPENDLLERGRFAWMRGYALADSCLGSYEHHQEHFDTLQSWLNEHEAGSVEE